MECSSAKFEVKGVKFAEESPPKEEEMKSKSGLSYCEQWEAQLRLEKERLKATEKDRMCSAEETASIHAGLSNMWYTPLEPEELKKYLDFFDEYIEASKARCLIATKGERDTPYVEWCPIPDPEKIIPGHTLCLEALASAEFALKTLNLGLVELIEVSISLLSGHETRYFVTAKASDQKIYKAQVYHLDEKPTKVEVISLATPDDLK